MKTESIQIGYDRATSQPIFEERPARVGKKNTIERDTPYSGNFVDYLTTLED